MKASRFSLTFVTFTVLASVAFPAGMIEQRIAGAREQIAKSRNAPQGYNELALALLRRARETADPKYCAEAETAVAESLKLDPKGFEALKTHAIVRLCQERWEDARAESAALNKRVPDDVMIWGYLADADTALGNYEAAEKSVQLMLDLRQVNPQGLQRGARLRELFGFNDPALEWWNSALRLTSATDLEERAWILTHIAEIHRILGRNEVAETTGKQAVELEPNYPWALEEIGRSQLASKKFGDAAETFRALTAVAPWNVTARFEQGLALASAGKAADAHAAFADFEPRAIALLNEARNANVALIRFYAGPGKKPSEAVRIARLTLEHRHDIYTVEAYAQALAAAGDYPAASAQIALSLKPGIKDPAWLLEAGRIEQKKGDAEAAHKYFQQALEAAPASPLVPEIIQALSGSGTGKTGS